MMCVIWISVLSCCPLLSQEYLWHLGQHGHDQGRPQGWLLIECMQAAVHRHHVDTLHVLACSFVRICDEGDEALQPEWEIDPKDLQLMEKVRFPKPILPHVSQANLVHLSSRFRCIRALAHASS